MNITEKIEYAKALSSSTLIPRHYQGQPANVLFAMEYGSALGLDAITAMQGIAIVQGRPTISADMTAALIRRAGHILRVSGDDERATAQIVRRDDPGYTHETTWTMDRAKRAGLTGKDVWRTYPAAMLKARAITEVARMACSEVLHGCIYLAEELEEAPAAPEDPVPTHPPVGSDADGQAPLVTSAQLKHIHALFTRIGLEDRDDRLRYAAAVVGRPVGSSKDLATPEAADLIEVLKLAVDQAEPLTWLGERISELEEATA